MALESLATEAAQQAGAWALPWKMTCIVGFPKIKGPCNKYDSMVGSVLGLPVFGNSHVTAIDP